MLLKGEVVIRRQNAGRGNNKQQRYSNLGRSVFSVLKEFRLGNDDFAVRCRPTYHQFCSMSLGDFRLGKASARTFSRVT